MFRELALAEVCEMNSGGTPRREFTKYYGGDIKWAKISDIENAEGGYLFQTEETITEEGLRSINNRIFPEKTLLLAMYGSVGKTAITAERMATNQAILGIRPKNGTVDLHYLKYWLDYVKPRLMHRAVGGTLQNISLKIVSELKIPLPPLPIQKKIAAILDKADSLRQKDKQLLEYYNKLAQSIFYDMFGDPVRNEKGWEILSIRDVVKEVKYGTSKPADDLGKYPYLRMNNITYGGEWDFTDLKHINLNDNELDKYLLQRDDLVFNRTNSKDLVGKTAVYKLEKQMAIAGYLIRVRTNEKANTDYISGFLNSKQGKDILRGMCKNIIGMANINAQELQDIRLPVPPRGLQEQFKNRIAIISNQKQFLREQLKFSEALFQSLLQKAFKGELVKES